MDNMTILWLALAIIAAVVEGFTTQLVSIWFVIGAVAACVTSAFTGNIPIQIGVFVVVSGLALILTRPLVKKLKRKPAEKTNSDKYIGQTGVVIKAINNEQAVGQVRVDSSVWSARSVDDHVIPEGAHVEVIEITGVKLIVRQID